MAPKPAARTHLRIHVQRHPNRVSPPGTPTGSGLPSLQQWTFGSGRNLCSLGKQAYTALTAIPATFIPSGSTDTTGCVAILS